MTDKSEFVFTKQAGQAASDALVELIEALPLHGFTELVDRANTVLRFVLAAKAAAPEAGAAGHAEGGGTIRDGVVETGTEPTIEHAVDALWAQLASPEFAGDVNAQRAAIRAALEVARSRA